VVATTADAIATSSGEKVQITITEKELIARGGWASVYRAKLIPDGHVVAIKEIKETKQYKVKSLKSCTN